MNHITLVREPGTRSEISDPSTSWHESLLANSTSSVGVGATQYDGLDDHCCRRRRRCRGRRGRRRPNNCTVSKR